MGRRLKQKKTAMANSKSATKRTGLARGILGRTRAFRRFSTSTAHCENMLDVSRTYCMFFHPGSLLYHGKSSVLDILPAFCTNLVWRQCMFDAHHVLLPWALSRVRHDLFFYVILHSFFYKLTSVIHITLNNILVPCCLFSHHFGQNINKRTNPDTVNFTTAAAAATTTSQTKLTASVLNQDHNSWTIKRNANWSMTIQHMWKFSG